MSKVNTDPRGSSVQPLVSVIVPMYQSEQTLADCLDSVLAQSFQEFEVICVDDASGDACGEIARAYARRDTRVRVISHDCNRGLGGARNTGIEAARAPWIASVDSDDQMQANMLGCLLQAQTKSQADLLVCGYHLVTPDGAQIKTVTPGERTLRQSDFASDAFSQINPAFWNKLWRRSVFVEHGIRFPERCYFQDSATTPLYVLKSHKVQCIDTPLYQYRKRLGSVTHSYGAQHVLDYMRVYQHLQQQLLHAGVWPAQRAAFERMVSASLSYHARNVMQLSLPISEQAQYFQALWVIKQHFSTVDAIGQRSPDAWLQTLSNPMAHAKQPEAPAWHETTLQQLEQRLVHLLCGPKRRQKYQRDRKQFFMDSRLPGLKAYAKRLPK